MKDEFEVYDENLLRHNLPIRALTEWQEYNDLGFYMTIVETEMEIATRLSPFPNPKITRRVPSSAPRWSLY